MLAFDTTDTGIATATGQGVEAADEVRRRPWARKAMLAVVLSALAFLVWCVFVKEENRDADGMTSPPGRVAKNHVQLAVSSIGPGAYHSSVVVDGTEYSFSDGGISTCQGLQSHTQQQSEEPKDEPTVIDYGMTHYTGSQVREALERFFLPGSYDLLRKNCNSFSDCAIFYLVHKRMDKKYRSMEKLGSYFSGIVQGFSGGQYTPNPKAVDFDVEKVIESIDPAKVWKTAGTAAGGTTVTSAEAMRDARLAALNRSASSSNNA